MLTLARIWYSAETAGIAPKDVAAAWALERLPDTYRPVLSVARIVYLRGDCDGADALLSGRPVAAFVRYVRRIVEAMLSV